MRGLLFGVSTVDGRIRKLAAVNNGSLPYIIQSVSMLVDVVDGPGTRDSYIDVTAYLPPL